MTDTEKNISEKAPIYLQICDAVRSKVISGEWKSGERIPSVREFAAAVSVNPNTVQKAFAVLEEQGILKSKSTAFRTVTDDCEFLTKIRTEYARHAVCGFISAMNAMNFTKEEIENITKLSLDSYFKESKGNTSEAQIRKENDS